MSYNDGISQSKVPSPIDPIPPIEDLPPPTGFASGWQRFWSKNFDILFLGGIVGGLVGLVDPTFFEAEKFAGSGGDSLAGLVILPFVLALDAIILSAFGNSIGRKMIGIRVETINRQKLDLGKSFDRAFRVWLFGFAIGFPIICLFTYSRNLRKLNRHEQTSWDQALSTRVYQHSASVARTWITALTTFALMLTFTTLSRMEEQGAFDDEPSIQPVYEDSLQTEEHSPLGPDPIEQQLKDAAIGLKPSMVDSITRMDGAEAEGRVLTYNYTVLRRDSSDEVFRKYFEETVRPNVCGDEDMATMLRDYQVVYRYNYTFPNASEPLVEKITWSDCDVATM